MERSVIYTVAADGALTAMRPSVPRSEDAMQALVAEYPALIAGEDRLLLIRREQPIADGEGASGRWSLDHLFVTPEGVPVLVELKRAADTRLRREVVGQMLDYAANATAYWQDGRIAESFAASVAEAGGDAELILAAFLGEAADASAFWSRVEANLAAGRMRMVFVADRIPRELARIVEFLNEQMTAAEVVAVELAWFESGCGLTALTPRVIGATERARTRKAGGAPRPPIEREAWIERALGRFDEAAVQGGLAFVALVEAAGGRAVVTTAQAAIVMELDAPGGVLYPLRLCPDRRGSVQLSLCNLVGRPGFEADAVRRRVYDDLVAIVGPLSTDNLRGAPAFDVRRLCDATVREGVSAFLARLRAMASGSHESAPKEAGR